MTTSKTSATKTARAGRTRKVSVSLDATDLLTLRERADRVYAGNLSAAIAEGARRIREEAGREALAAWIAEEVHASPADRDAVREEWRATREEWQAVRPAPTRARRRRPA